MGFRDATNCWSRQRKNRRISNALTRYSTGSDAICTLTALIWRYSDVLFYRTSQLLTIFVAVVSRLWAASFSEPHEHLLSHSRNSLHRMGPDCSLPCRQEGRRLSLSWARWILSRPSHTPSYIVHVTQSRWLSRCAVRTAWAGHTISSVHQ
jgi:hypothetical protein